MMRAGVSARICRRRSATAASVEQRARAAKAIPSALTRRPCLLAKDKVASPAVSTTSAPARKAPNSRTVRSGLSTADTAIERAPGPKPCAISHDATAPLCAQASALVRVNRGSSSACGALSAFRARRSMRRSSVTQRQAALQLVGDQSVDEGGGMAVMREQQAGNVDFGRELVDRQKQNALLA